MATDVRVELLPAGYGALSATHTLVEGVVFSAAHAAFSTPEGTRVEFALADLVGAVVIPVAAGVMVSAISYTASTATSCGTGKPDRRRRVLPISAFPASSDGTSRAERLSTALWCAAQGVEVLGARPARRRFLVLINPASGQGKGVKTFRETCAPILEDGNCELTTITTRHAGHASDMLRDMPASELLAFQGILAGGGDGSLHEVIQGLMARPDWALVASSVTLGSLPTGSGNGIAASLCASVGLPFSIVNATIFIAKNMRAPLDLASTFVANGPGPAGWGERRYSFLSTTWGIVGDLDIESESMRFLGHTRFDVMGFIRAIALRKYRGRLWYVPALPQHENTGTHGESSAAPSTREGLAVADDISVAPARARGADAPTVTLLRPFHDSLPVGPDGGLWKCIEGPFALVYFTSTSHQSIGVTFSPEAHHHDGLLSGMVIGDVSPLQMISALLSLDAVGSLSKLDFVKTFTCRAFRLEVDMQDPLKSLGHVVVDGENVAYGSVQSEVHPGLLSLYGPLCRSP